MLVEGWQFPKNLSDTIRHHHDPELQETTLQNCLYVANQLSKHESLHSNGHSKMEALPPAIVERFGGNLDEILVKLGDLSNVVAEAQAFVQISKEIHP